MTNNEYGWVSCDGCPLIQLEYAFELEHIGGASKISHFCNDCHKRMKAVDIEYPTDAEWDAARAQYSSDVALSIMSRMRKQMGPKEWQLFQAEVMERMDAT